MTVNLTEGLNRLDAALQPVSAPSTGWTEGVTIQKVRVLPSVAYLGETVRIQVGILYACDCSASVPADIHGVVLINGVELHEDFRITFRNPTLVFEYTPTTPGTFTVSPGGVTLTVVQDVAGTYYPPIGGIRIPVCSDILIPDMPPFVIIKPSYFSHPGGDLLWSSILPSFINYGYDASYFKLPSHAVFKGISFTAYQALKTQLSKARPITWNPSSASVTKWVTQYSSGLSASFLVMATEYTCNGYWDSKAELADMMVQHLTLVQPLAGWVPYGTTINLNSGLRDWVKGIGYKAVQTTLAHWREYVYCPYCNQEFEGQEHGSGLSHEQLYPYKLSLVRQLLVHIETEHPNHPLTEPAWF